MLARLPPTDVTVEAVIDMDDTRINADQVELLLANAPSSEELASLRSAAAEWEHDPETEGHPDWGVAEAFIWRLSEVPSLSLRLQLWAFENSFDERFEGFHSAALEVHAACISLQESPQIQRLLGLGLSVGNYLNAGTSRGRADGFTVEALALMRTLKTQQPGKPGSVVTLVDFLVRQLERATPGGLASIFAEEKKAGEGGEAQAVRRAARHKLADLSLEFGTFRAQAEGLVRRTAAVAVQDDGMSLAIRGQRAEARLRELDALQERFVEAEKRYRSLCAWFHEGVARAPRPSDEFFSVWDGFLQAVRVSLEGLSNGSGVGSRSGHRRSLSKPPQVSEEEAPVSENCSPSKGR
jgi:hypothetical protein